MRLNRLGLRSFFFRFRLRLTRSPVIRFSLILDIGLGA